MIKMRRVIEIKFGAAGGPAHSVNPCPGANRFLVLVQKPEIFLHKLMWSVHDWHSFYKLSARDIGLAIELG